MFNSTKKWAGASRLPVGSTRTAVILAAVVLSAAALTAPDAQAQARKGSFNFSGGLGFASEQTIDSEGGVSSGDSKTGLVLSADYRYPVSGKISLGPALQYWSLGSSSQTSLAALASYRTSDAGSVHLALGSGVRIGYSQLIGSGAQTGRGLFVTAEYVSPNDDVVDSFGHLGVGYRF